MVLEEAEFERTESTLVTVTAELTEKSNLADQINKAIKVLETKNMIDEESKFESSVLYLELEKYIAKDN